MGNSLRDQLLQTGLASKQQAHQVENERRKKRKEKAPSENVDKHRSAIQQVQSEKLVRDRALNSRRHEESQRKALAAQVRELIESNRLPHVDAQSAYSFVDGVTVRRLYLQEEQCAQLANGRLAIVRLDTAYEVVPDVIADKISERDPSVIVVRNRPDSTPDPEDGPYARYQVPDDLKW